MQKNLNIWSIAKESLIQTWENKFLWILGFLAAPGFSSGINFDFNSSSNYDQLRQAEVFLNNHPTAALTIFLLLILLSVLFFVARILSQASIIKSLTNLPLSRELSLYNRITFGKEFFNNLFFLEIFTQLFVFAIFFLLALPAIILFSLNNKPIGIITAILGFIILLPIIFTISLTKRYSLYYIVLAKQPLKKSIQGAYLLLNKNLHQSLLGLMLHIVTLVAAAIAFAGVTALLLMFFAIFGLIGYYFKASFLLILTAVLGLLSVLMNVILVTAIWKTFVESFWLKLFLSISTKSIQELPAAEKIFANDNLPDTESTPIN